MRATLESSSAPKYCDIYRDVEFYVITSPRFGSRHCFFNCPEGKVTAPTLTVMCKCIDLMLEGKPFLNVDL